jgi:hypothetical protein
MLNTRLHLMPRLGMSGDVLLLPLYAFMTYSGTALTLYVALSQSVYYMTHLSLRKEY